MLYKNNLGNDNPGASTKVEIKQNYQIGSVGCGNADLQKVEIWALQWQGVQGDLQKQKLNRVIRLKSNKGGRVNLQKQKLNRVIRSIDSVTREMVSTKVEIKQGYQIDCLSNERNGIYKSRN